MELYSIVSTNSSNLKVEFSIDLVIAPLWSTKPLIFYADSIDYSKPRIVVSKRYIVSFTFKANRVIGPTKSI